MPEPILVVGFPRSGTSITGGLVASQGVWFGTCRGPAKHNITGDWENLPVKKLMIEMFGRKALTGEVEPQAGFRKRVEDTIRADGYEGGPWGMKFSAKYVPAWFEFSPKWIKVRRDEDSIVRSCTASRIVVGDEEMIRAAIRRHVEIMDSLDGPEVWPERFVNGDLGGLKEALAHCGLELRNASMIEGSAWHFHSGQTRDAVRP